MKKIAHSGTFEQSQFTLEMTHCFMRTFRVLNALARSNAYKQKGYSVASVFLYLFEQAFRNRSLFWSVSHQPDGPKMKKDCFYRFLKSASINWQKFIMLLSLNVARKIMPLTDASRVNVFIADDTLQERPRSKKVELLCKVFDHTSGTYTHGYRLLTLAWSDGNSCIPISYSLLSSNKKSAELRESGSDKRTCSYRRKAQALTPAPTVLLELLDKARKAGHQAKYVLFDTWFSSPHMLKELVTRELHVICMVKKNRNYRYRYDGKTVSLTEIYRLNKKRPGRSKYLLSVQAELYRRADEGSEESAVPVRLVFVRKHGNKKQYLVLLSTDTSLSEEEIIRIYGKRWGIETLFQICKSTLLLGKESRGTSYDAMCAYTAIVFSRYLMLAWERRVNCDDRTAGEIFYKLTEEMADITWVEAWKLLLSVFNDIEEQWNTLTQENLRGLVKKFLAELPESIKLKLKIAPDTGAA